MTGVKCSIAKPKDKISKPLYRARQYLFYWKSFLTVNLKRSVIYLLHRLSQNNCVITELPRLTYQEFQVQFLVAIKLNFLWNDTSSTATGVERLSVHYTFLSDVSMMTYKTFLLQDQIRASFWDFMINSRWLLALIKNTKKKESGSVGSSVCKQMLRDVCTILFICKGSVDINSSFSIIWRQLWQVTWCLKVVVCNLCA